MRRKARSLAVIGSVALAGFAVVCAEGRTSWRRDAAREADEVERGSARLGRAGFEEVGAAVLASASARSTLPVERATSNREQRPFSSSRAADDAPTLGERAGDERRASEPIGALSLDAYARPDAVSLARVTGRDSAGPRELWLWRVNATTGRAARIAAGESDRYGWLRFERVLLPPGEVRLVATPVGGDPAEPSSSRAIDWPAVPSAIEGEAAAAPAPRALPLPMGSPGGELP